MNEDKKTKRISKESAKKALGIYKYIEPYKYRFIIGLVFLALSKDTSYNVILGKGKNVPETSPSTIKLRPVDAFTIAASGSL